MNATLTRVSEAQANLTTAQNKRRRVRNPESIRLADQAVEDATTALHAAEAADRDARGEVLDGLTMAQLLESLRHTRTAALNAEMGDSHYDVIVRYRRDFQDVKNAFTRRGLDPNVFLLS